jgi:hypothetical protein
MPAPNELQQLYFSVGVPIVVNIVFNGTIAMLLTRHFDSQLALMREVWRAELRRVEEVLDARLKHLEEERRG